MTALTPASAPAPAPVPDPTTPILAVAGEAAVWRRLVEAYQQACETLDTTPSHAALKLLEARAAVAGTRWALFAYLKRVQDTPQDTETI